MSVARRAGIRFFDFSPRRDAIRDRWIIGSQEISPDELRGLAHSDEDAAEQVLRARGWGLWEIASAMLLAQTHYRKTRRE